MGSWQEGLQLMKELEPRGLMLSASQTG